MTSSRSGDARRGGSQHGEPEIHGGAGVRDQATSTGARPDLDSDEPDSPPNCPNRHCSRCSSGPASSSANTV
jgi:hypothetical protein